jgi:hypothetical protein
MEPFALASVLALALLKALRIIQRLIERDK